MSCARCRSRSRLARLFSRRAWGVGGRGLLCPRCVASLPEVTQWMVYEFFGAAWLLSLALTWLGPGGHATLEFLEWTAVFIAVRIAVVVLHELSHAAAARAVGGRVYELGLGSAMPWQRLRFGQATLTLGRAFMSGGYTRAFFPAGTSRARLAFYFGAPFLTHVAAVAASWKLTFLAGAQSVPGGWDLFAAYNAYGFVFNALPRNFRLVGQVIPSDSIQLYRVATWPDAPERFRRDGYVGAIVHALRNGNPDRAASLAGSLLGEQPENDLYLSLHVSALLGQGRDAEALHSMGRLRSARSDRVETEGEREVARGLLVLGQSDLSRLPPLVFAHVKAREGALEESLSITERALGEETIEEARALWLNNLAFYTVVASQTSTALARAEAAARDAFEMLPWVGHIRGTLGIVRVESGALDEGLALLESADRDDTTEDGRAIRRAYRALGHARAGRLDKAAALLRQKSKPDPVAASVIRRAQELVAGQASRSS